MQGVYEEAATLVQQTLELDGAFVLDVSHFEAVEALDDGDEAAGGGPKRSVIYHADPYEVTSGGLTIRNGPHDRTRSHTVTSPSPTHSSRDGSSTVRPSSTDSGKQRRHEFGSIPPLPVLAMAESSVSLKPSQFERLDSADHAAISDFLATCKDGRIFERLPRCFRGAMPRDIRYAMGMQDLANRCQSVESLTQGIVRNL